MVRLSSQSARASEPVAQSAFDIYAGNDALGGDTLIYVKEPCAEEDTLGRFFLRAFPVRQESLREDSKARGDDYDRFGFDFLQYGALYGGACVIVHPLPNHPVRAVETGRALPDAPPDGQADSWSVSFALDKHADAYARTRAARPVVESPFDIYVAADGAGRDALTYVKEPCADEDARGRFQLWAFPADADDLSLGSKRGGLAFNSLNFGFHDYGVMSGGGCVITRTLPSYPMTHLEIGQWTPGEGALWSARVNFAAGLELYRRAAAALSEKPPAIDADFAVHLADRSLVYVKDPCEADDVRGRFLLSITPANAEDLSEGSRERGLDHNALNFDFERYGVNLNGKCVIMRDLPDYPIAGVETGQWIPGEGGRLWDGKIAVGE